MNLIGEKIQDGVLRREFRLNVAGEDVPTVKPEGRTCRALDHTRPDQTLWVDIEERSVGECRDAAEAVLTALTDEGQDVAFTVTEDPKYEWLGTLCRYQPGKGMHEVDCDANAQAVLTDGELATLISTLPDPAAILDQITATLGLDWQTPSAA